MAFNVPSKMHLESEYETTRKDFQGESKRSGELEITLSDSKVYPSENLSQASGSSTDDLGDKSPTNEEDKEDEPEPSHEQSPADSGTELDIDSEMTEDLKVGRWTNCKGAARKQSRTSSKSRIVDGQASPTSHEVDKLDIYRESQRLVREANIHILEHKPKQFKRFSEFRQSLTRANGVSELPTPPTSEAIPEQNIFEAASTGVILEPDQSKLTESDLEGRVPEAIQQFTAGDITPVSNGQTITSLPQLPSVLPPVKKLGEGEHDMIDLGESLLPVSKPVLTPVDQLMARLLKHSRPPPPRKEHGPVEYEVITKVVDPETGSDQLHVEKVKHNSEQQPETIPASQRRKFWQQHREKLKEQMRQRRLQLYEERMREARERAGEEVPTAQREQQLSDDDEEWSEGEDAVSSSASTSSSSSCASSDEEDENDEDNDEDDDEDSVLGPSSRRHSCAFADEEAEESSDSADEEGGSQLDTKFVAEEGLSNDSHSKRANVTSAKNSSSYNRSNTSRFEKFLELDDYTDLPAEQNPPSLDSSRQFYVNSALRSQGTLGPGDVDLFTSDYSTMLDRTTNVPSVLASTRLEKSVINDPQRATSSRASRESSTHSQWNDTPYELLYSQRALSQKSSFSDKAGSSIAPGSTTNSGDVSTNPASQDTVLLSQASWNTESESLAKDVPLTQESQVEHANRQALFSDPSQRTDFDELGPLQSSEVTQESQKDHAARLQLFAGSFAMESQPSVQTTIQAVENESQNEHENRLQLFAGSFCTQPNLGTGASTQSVASVPENVTPGSQPHESENQMTLEEPTELVCSTASDSEPPAATNLLCDSEPESQRVHDARLQLFAGSFAMDSSLPVDNRIEELTPVETSLESGTLGNPSTQPTPAISTANDELLENSNTSKLTEESEITSESTQEVEAKQVRRHRLVIQEEEEEDEPDNFAPYIKSNWDAKNVSLDLKTTSSRTSKIDEDSFDDSMASVNSDEDPENDDTDSVGSQEEKELSDGENEYASEDEELAQLKQLKNVAPVPERKKRFRADNFLDEEAELSGDENERAYYMDDEDEDAVDGDSDGLELVDDTNLPSAGRLRRQVERVHQRLQADQDQRELRFLKELYFEDGDLYAETGRVRQRRFRWRGLDAEDPSVDQFETEGADYSEEEEEDQDRVPFGPMDRWLAGGLHRNPVSTDKVDLDAGSPTQQAAEKSSSDIDNAASDVDNDENNDPSALLVNSESQTSISLQSLGRQALIKSKSRKQTLLVPDNKKHPPQQTSTAPLKPTCLVNSQSTLVTTLQTKKLSESNTVLQYYASSSTTLSRSDTIPLPINGDAPLGNGKLRKHGSLLSRGFTTPNSNIRRFISEDSQSESNQSSNDGISPYLSNSSSQPNPRRNQAHFLGLRNKVGLSCFNVLGQSGFSTPDSSSQDSGAKRPPSTTFARPAELGKRISVISHSPPKLKRPRSVSVFSALQ